MNRCFAVVIRVNRQKGICVKKGDGGALQRISRMIQSPRMLFSILSVACYWSIVFLTFWSGPFIGDSSSAGDIGASYRIWCLSGQLLGLAVVVFFWKSVSTNKRLSVLVWLGAGLSTLVIVPGLFGWFGLVLPLPISVGCYLLFGCGIACLLSRIAFILDEISGPELCSALALSVLASCLICVLFIVVCPLLGLLILPLLCGVFTYLANGKRKTASRHDFQGVTFSAIPDSPALPVYRQFFVQILFYSIVFVLMQYFEVKVDLGFQYRAVYWVIILITGVALLVYSLFIRRYVSPQSFLWFMFPLAALGLLLVPLVSQEYRFLGWLLVSFGFTFFDIMSMFLLSGFIKFNNLSVVRYFAMGRLANALGMVLGWGCGMLLFSLLPFDQQIISYTSALLVVVLVILLVAFRRPRSSGESPSREEHWSEVPADTAAPLYKRTWQDCCEYLSVRYGLSPRESEVFTLLSRGRSQKYISEHLFISQTTSKTHSYRIYKKLDVNSQQELIDLVEGFHSP